MESSVYLSKPKLKRSIALNSDNLNKLGNNIIENINIYFKIFQFFHIYDINIFNNALHPNYDFKKKKITNKMSLFPLNIYKWCQELMKKNVTLNELFEHLIMYEPIIKKNKHIIMMIIEDLIFEKNKNCIDLELKYFFDNTNIFLANNVNYKIENDINSNKNNINNIE